MKKLLLILGGLLYISTMNAQVFEWIKNKAVNYSFNPTYPSFPVAYDELNDRVIDARLDSFVMIYGSATIGKNMIESRDTNGAVVWQFEMGNHVNVQRIATDLSGNIIVGGQFRETINLNNTDSLVYFNAGVNGWNIFMIKFDAQGNLIWKRNKSVEWPLYDGIEASAIDPGGNCWYALTDFFTAKIVSIDANGNDVVERTIYNGKTIGNISFEPSGGMYISGGAQFGNFVMDADTFFANNQYNMFIARYNSQGQAAWAYFGNDITFQRPMITTDPAGNVFFAGMRFDTTSFNGFFIPYPVPFGDFFGFKADTAGNVQWAVHQPQLLIGPFGHIETGSNLFVDADANGNFYMGGVQQGYVDWGNGYISATSTFSDHKIAIAKINEFGSTQWVKLGGSDLSNYMHALAVSDGGSCYFTGSFGDTANFDNIFIPTTDFYNFLVGKISVLPTAVPEFETENSILIFPNPASNTIYFNNSLTGSRWEIIDVTGRIIKAENKSVSNAINIASLAPGSYIIRFEDGNKRFRKNFIKSE